MNPAFELDQIHRYIDHLQGDPRQLGKTVETHFFPVLQSIFFREAFEVRSARSFNGRAYPFQVVDLDGKRPEVFVDFGFTIDGAGAMSPGPVIEARRASAALSGAIPARRKMEDPAAGSMGRGKRASPHRRASPILGLS